MLLEVVGQEAFALVLDWQSQQEPHTPLLWAAAVVGQLVRLLLVELAMTRLLLVHLFLKALPVPGQILLSHTEEGEAEVALRHLD